MVTTVKAAATVAAVTPVAATPATSATTNLVSGKIAIFTLTHPRLCPADVMKFNGPGPELINGRLAMLGILAAARNETQTGFTVVQQVQHASVLDVAVLLVTVYASLVPLLKGARHEAFGIFSPRAEITNGRAAMLGFAVLLALEYKAGVPFF
eukprot:GHRR01028588.1.p2 GENE.GHRR01028588.1~~GHRR01028588.1.p2  ORF type:complete len:153 (+),score=54.81 GHRR01028588.1:789-1247(+)